MALSISQKRNHIQQTTLARTFFPGKKYFVLLLFTTVINVASFAQIVNIPDANFKNALLNHIPVINTNGDSEIQVSEAQAFNGGMDVTGKNISNLTGISSFTNLYSLYCAKNQLTALNLSANTALLGLNCDSNQLTSLNLSANTALNSLYCSYNQLSNLNLSSNTALTMVTCKNNQLNSLNISGITGLNTLRCQNNQLTTLNISNSNFLFDLDCSYNLLTSLPLNSSLIYFLQCRNNQISNLNLTGSSLYLLTCDSNQITSLNLSNFPALSILTCGGNQLSSLALTNNTALTVLGCENNQLSALNLANNTALNLIACGGNLLTSLDVSSDTVLTDLICNNNQLTSLNVANGHNSMFNQLWAQNNLGLSCIQVDDATYSATNWTGSFFQFDAGANFSQNCSASAVNDLSQIALIEIYPNPASKNITVQNSFVNVCFAISIFDVMGKEVHSFIAQGSKAVIDVSVFENGIYFVQAVSENKTISQKLIVHH